MRLTWTILDNGTIYMTGRAEHLYDSGGTTIGAGGGHETTPFPNFNVFTVFNPPATFQCIAPPPPPSNSWSRPCLRLLFLVNMYEWMHEYINNFKILFYFLVYQWTKIIFDLLCLFLLLFLQFHCSGWKYIDSIDTCIQLHFSWQWELMTECQRIMFTVLLVTSQHSSAYCSLGDVTIYQCILFSKWRHKIEVHTV